MSGVITGKVSGDLAAEEGDVLDPRLKELYCLSAEVVDLFHTQAFSPDTISTPADVCATFAGMIVRHWDLCCIVIYLQDEEGRLRESAMHTHEHFDEKRAREVSASLAASVEREGREVQAWVDESGGGARTEEDRQLLRMLEDAGLRAGVAVPIHARGNLVGALM